LDAAKEAGKAVPNIAAVELGVTNTTSVGAAVERSKRVSED